MKVSQFTRYTKFEDGLVLYNTYSGSLGFVSKSKCQNEYQNIKRSIDEKMNHQSLDLIDYSEFFISNFCVDDDVDEINMVSEDYLYRCWDPRNIFFICVLNNFCNFNCQYCYENHNEREFSKESMDNLLNSIIAYNQHIKLSKIGVEWYGGEPLLSKDRIIYFTRELNAFCECNNISPVYAITTNGYDLLPEVVNEFLDLGINSFQITIDGDPNLHNKLRPLKNGDGTWDRIIENLKYMASLDKSFHVMIRVNYTYETLEHFDQLLDLIKINFDIDRFSIFFHGISDWGGSSSGNTMVIDDDKVKTYIACEMIERSINKGINITRLNTAFSRYGRVCYASIPNHFVVSADEKLRKCTFDMPEFDDFNCVGDISDAILSVNRIKSSNFETPKHYNDKCMKCDILPICMNMSCPKTNLHRENINCSIDRILIDKVYEAKYRLIKKGQFSTTRLTGILY